MLKKAIGADLCQIGGSGSIPMYSFDRAATILYQGVYDGLRSKGLTHKKAIEWLQSKETRWALDGHLGIDLSKLGFTFGATTP